MRNRQYTHWRCILKQTVSKNIVWARRSRLWKLKILEISPDFTTRSLCKFQWGIHAKPMDFEVFNFLSIHLRAQTIFLVTVCFKTHLLCPYFRFRLSLSIQDTTRTNGEQDIAKSTGERKKVMKKCN